MGVEPDEFSDRDPIAFDAAQGAKNAPVTDPQALNMDGGGNGVLTGGDSSPGPVVDPLATISMR